MKLRRTLALMVALGGLAGTAMTGNLVAQTKKDDKKPAAGADDKKPAAKASGKIEIFQDKKEMWRYRIVNNDDKSIASATKGYAKKDDVLKELDEIKSILDTQKPVEVKD